MQDRDSTRCARNTWILAQLVLDRCADERQHPGIQLVSQIFTRISNKKMDQIVARISKNSYVKLLVSQGTTVSLLFTILKPILPKTKI